MRAVTHSSHETSVAVAEGGYSKGRRNAMMQSRPDQNQTTPTVVLYGRATSWLVSSLAGDLDPRQVGVIGDEALVRVAQNAFPEAEVRRLLADEDPSWADLVITLGKEPAQAWYSRPPAA